MNLPMNNKPMKMKLLILLCMAALPAMSVRAADNAEKPTEAKILPDGVYRVRGEDSTEKGVTVKRCDTDGTVILLDRLTRQFGTASMTSAANDNTRFRIDLKSAGPFAEGEGTGHKALVIDGLCATVWGQSDPDKQHRMDLSSQVVGKEASAKIAARLGIEPRMRHHPGHRMEVRYLPKKPVFKPGEPVVLRMEIRNVGDRTFTFVDGGQQRGPRNNQFGFTAFRSAGKGAEVPDTGDADNFGGPSGFITLEPGQVFGKEVDLTKWFDLSKPDTYKIEGRFEMNISRNPADCRIFGWDEVAQGTTMVTLGDGGAAVENADQEVEKLLSELSDSLRMPSAENMKRQPGVEAKLVALGEQALPVLERELHLGITFPELNEMLKAGQSHRWAVVAVLARIPGEKSTGLLYRSLFNPPDNFAMRSTTLATLKNRDLSDEMLVGLLSHRETPVVLAGIEKAVSKAASPKIRAALEPLTREDLLEVQFKNEYKASISSKENRWDVCYAAGLALGRDMTDDMRARAAEILQLLKAAAEHLYEPDNRKTMGYTTQRETEIHRNLDGLASMGQGIAGVVEREAGIADADYATLLDMAKARLGNADSLQRVTGIMNEAANPSIRLCAAITLRKLKNPAVKAAFWKALQDPYHRESHGCLAPSGSPEVYPVRIVAADALIDLGEDPVQVRATLKQGIETFRATPPTMDPATAHPTEPPQKEKATRESAAEAGRQEAATALKEGKLCWKQCGQPMAHDDLFKTVLKDDYNMDLLIVAGCVVPDELAQNVKGYNEVMAKAMVERFKKDVIPLAEAKAKQLFEAQRKK